MDNVRLFSRSIGGLLLAVLCVACGPATADKSSQVTVAMETNEMLEKINDPTVKTAMEAWQGKDLEGWLSHFTDDATLFDDGNPRDFHSFSREIGKERFTSIDKIENGGLDIYGQFHSDSWGNFKTYFKFHRDASGRFNRLDIGQADY